MSRVEGIPEAKRTVAKSVKFMFSRFECGLNLEGGTGCSEDEGGKLRIVTRFVALFMDPAVLGYLSPWTKPSPNRNRILRRHKCSKARILA